jgi:ribosomal protein S6E (S10)
MAFPVTLNGRTYTLADFEGTNYVDGLPDAFEDFVTHAGDIYNSTSTSSVAIGTGSKTFTTADSGKPYQAGTPLRIADAAAPETNFMDAIVTSYSGTTLVVDVFGYAGSGTKTSWTINIGGAKTVDGTLAIAQGGTGATSAADARTNIDVYSKAEADSKFLDVSGEASNVTMTGDVTIGDAGTDTLTVNAAATFVNGVSFGDNVISGDDIDGGTISNFASTGIDDNATSTAITVDSSQNVGIGLSDPQGFRIATRYNDNMMRLRGSALEYLDFTASTASDHLQINAVNGDLSLAVNSSEKVRIETSGNVGIGTDSPSGITSGITALSISDSGAKTTGDKIGALAFVTDDGSFTGTYSDGVGVELAAVAESATGGAYGLAITTGTTGSAGRSERVRIDNSGYVGIGTDPTSLLHIGSTGTPTFRISDQDTTNSYSELAYNAGTLFIRADEGNVVAGTSMRFELDGSERMRINDSGAIIHHPGTSAERKKEYLRFEEVNGTTGTLNIALSDGGSFFIRVGTAHPLYNGEIYAWEYFIAHKASTGQLVTAQMSKDATSVSFDTSAVTTSGGTLAIDFPTGNSTAGTSVKSEIFVEITGDYSSVSLA